MDVQDRKRITSGTTPTPVTTTIISQTAFVRQIIISIADAGTAWKLRIQDKDTIPFILVNDYTLTIAADGKPTMLDFTAQAGDLGAYMVNGVDIVTTGTMAGAVCVWISSLGGS
jgi:hypothetical protein